MGVWRAWNTVSIFVNRDREGTVLTFFFMRVPKLFFSTNNALIAIIVGVLSWASTFPSVSIKYKIFRAVKTSIV